MYSKSSTKDLFYIGEIILGAKMRIRQIKEIEVDDLGNQIAKARIAISPHKKLEAICNEVGVSKTYWYDIEKDNLRGSLSIENLRKIEKALNIDLGISFEE